MPATQFIVLPRVIAPVKIPPAADLRRPGQPASPMPEPPVPPKWRARAVMISVVVVTVLLGGIAWGLKGKGYWYGLKVRLGLIEPYRPVAMSPTCGGTPVWDRSDFTSPPVDPDLRFEKVTLPTTTGVGYTGVAVGPDGALWASGDDGHIFRFAISETGDLGTPEVFESLRQAHGGPRLLTGFCFDPNAPADEPVLYAVHGDFAFSDARDWSGTVTRLSGPGLQDVQDLVIHLPRSVGDHATNQPTMGPDGALYFAQASNTALGDPDETWGMRPEHLLSATILRLDPSAPNAEVPLDVKTDEGGSYDPSSPSAPLTVYALGVRLAYDLCWADDGRLYVPVNGSSPGGNVPAAPDGSAPALKAVGTSEHDWLIRAEPGRYYGHPNPRQGYHILNGANPSAGTDFGEVIEYPVGTRPDPRWHQPIADLGDHQSPNGILQYRAVGNSAGEAKLDRTLIICRYSFGADLIAVHLTDDGVVAEVIEGIPGFFGFANPLDVTQDPATGYLYVADYGTREIVLVKPAA